MKIYTNIFLIGASLSICVACSLNTVTTHQSSEAAAPKIIPQSMVAEYQIVSTIYGKGCSNEYLSTFNSGNTKFLEIYGGGLTNPTAKAKAAAAYNALNFNSGLTTDILVQPVWEITEQRNIFGIVTNEVCAKVVGYRGKIKRFRPTETISDNSQNPIEKVTVGTVVMQSTRN